MQHYIDVVQDRSGNAIGNAIVTVKNNSSGQTAPTYSDSAGLIPLTSIMTANNGTFSFYIASGRYNISITKNGVLLNAINDIFITVTADYPTAMSQDDAIAGINLTPQTISADVLQGAMPTAMSYADAVAGTSTTPQSISPNVLVASNIVQKYAGVNNIPANFAGIAKVGTDLYVGDGTNLSKEVSSVYLTPTLSDNTTATANTTALQNALTAGGTVDITTPGVYYLGIDGPLTDANSCIYVPSDVMLNIGSGVILRALNSNARCLFINTNWKSNKFTVSTISQAANSGGGYVVTIGATSHNLVVGDYAYIKNDTSNTINGVYKVTAVGTGTLSFIVQGYGVFTFSYTGTPIVYKANKNIAFIGEGLIDYNFSGTTNLQSMGSIFNKIGDLTWSVNTSNATKYCLYVGNSLRFIGDSKKGSTPSDTFHFVGPSQDIYVKTLYGSSGDDVFAITTSNPGYTNVDLFDADGTRNSFGDIKGITIGSLVVTAESTRQILLACSDEGNIEDVYIGSIISHGTHTVNPLVNFGFGTASGVTSGKITNVHIGSIIAQCDYRQIYIVNQEPGCILSNFNIDSINIKTKNNSVGLQKAIIFSQAPIEVSIGSINAEVDTSNSNGYGGFGAIQTTGSLVGSYKIQISSANIKTTGLTGTISFSIADLRHSGSRSTVQLGKIIVESSVGNGFNGISAQNCLDATNIYSIESITSNTSFSAYAFALSTDKSFKSFYLGNIQGNGTSSSISAINFYPSTPVELPVHIGNLLANGGYIQTNAYVKLSVGGGNCSQAFNISSGAGVRANGNIAVAGLNFNGTTQIDVTNSSSGSVFYNNASGFGAGVGLYAKGATAFTRIAA